jgi:hypothetical protein
MSKDWVQLPHLCVWLFGVENGWWDGGGEEEVEVSVKVSWRGTIAVSPSELLRKACAQSWKGHLWQPLYTFFGLARPVG